MRLTIDHKIRQTEMLIGRYAYETIDDIYNDSRNAVNDEIDQVDDLFLLDAAKSGALPNDIELTNLLYDRDVWEKNAIK